MTTIPAYDPTLFQGAAWYYARYRTKYPQALFDLLTDVFKLDGKGRLLDLGCGAGLVGIPFHNRFAEGASQFCKNKRRKIIREYISRIIWGFNQVVLLTLAQIQN